LHQQRRTAIDEALLQSLVKSVGQFVFDRTGHLLPVPTVARPARSVCGVGPGSYLGQSPAQRGDIALSHIETSDLSSEPVVGKYARIAHQVQIDRTNQTDVFVDGKLAKVG